MFNCTRFFKFHHWGPWETDGTGPLVDTRGDQIGVYLRQKRKCLDCGFIQVNNKTTI